MTENYQSDGVDNAINPFELFNLKFTFFIEEEKLNKTYKSLLMKFHPDNFSQATSKEKLMATKVSADIINAYALLINPVKRAEYLLNKSGCKISLENMISQDQQLMIEQIEYREQLECCQASDLAGFAAKIDYEYKQILNCFALKLEESDLSFASKLLLRMRFYQKLLLQIAEKQRQ